ncbi:MAG: hypothetical protein ACI90E_002934, partial [Yoonia sp.]
DQARYLIACTHVQARILMEAAKRADVTLVQVGNAGGTTLSFGEQSAPLRELALVFRSSFAKAIA